MADLSVLVDAETLLDRDFIYGAARFVASQNARTTGLRDAQVKVVDTPTVVLNPLAAAPPAEALKVATLIGYVEVVGLGAAVKVQDQTPQVQLVSGLAVTVPAESPKIADSGRIDLYGLGAWVKVQDQTPQVALVGAAGDLSRQVSDEGLKVQDTATVLENPLIAVPALELVTVADSTPPLAGIVGNLSVLVTAEGLIVADTGPNYAALDTDEGLRIADTVTASITPLLATAGPESLKVQDTALPALQLAVAVTDEPLKLTDAVTVRLNPLQTSLGDELLHVQDLPPSTGNTLTVNLPAGESLKLADTVTVIEDPLQSALTTEALKLADTATVFENPLQASTPAESLKVQDLTPLANLGGLAAPVADEPLKLTDAVTVRLNPLQTSLGDELLHVQDLPPSTGNTLTVNLPAGESLKLADTVTVIEDPLQSALTTEALKLADTAIPSLTPLLVVVFETLVLSEHPIAGTDLLGAQVSETLHVQDTVRVLANMADAYADGEFFDAVSVPLYVTVVPF